MEQTSVNNVGDSRAQVLNVIDFLSAYDAQRNPPVRRIDDYAMFRLRSTSLPQHTSVKLRPTDDVWMSVDFIDLPITPTVPDRVAPMLVDSARLSAKTEPELVQPPESDASNVDTELPPNALSSLPAQDEAGRAELVAEARVWIDKAWRPWAAEWLAVQDVKQLHRALFEQRERLALDRESVELVWGFGRLRWTAHEGAGAVVVDHPLLTVPVEIDAGHGSEQLRVKPSGPLEVEGRPLIGLEMHDRAGYSAIRQAIAGDPIDPWIDEDRDELLRRLVRAVDDEGVLASGGSPRSGISTVDSGWTLFLRRRRPDSEGFLQAMRDLYLDDLDAIPAPLRSILTNEGSPADADTEYSDGGRDSAAQDPLLLPLPANEQQQRILRLAQRHPGVAVQGPPGTGKSHTIANLISHYVAYGKRVLVVAEKEQALKVLADKVPSGIRDLTVSVLGADEEGRRRLGKSISQIQTRVGQVDRSAADARIAEITSELDIIDRRYAETTGKLLRTRQAEIHVLPGNGLAGSPVTPQVAAEWVANHQSEYGYIPDSIDATAPPPLSVGDLAEFLDLNEKIGSEKGLLATQVLPDRSRLKNPDEVGVILRQVGELSTQADNARRVLRDWSRVASAGIELLQELAEELVRERDWYVKIATGWSASVLQQLADPLLVTEWAGFVHDLTTLRERVLALRAGFRAHAIKLPDQPQDQTVSDLKDARDRLKSSGKLGVFARDAKRALEQCLIDGAIPGTAEQVQMCLDAIEVERLRHRIAIAWLNQTSHLGAPPLTGYPEFAVHDRLDEIRAVQSAQERWAGLSRRLEGAGLPVTSRPGAESLDGLATLCVDAIAALNRTALQTELTTLRRELLAGSAGLSSSPEWLDLADAVAAGDVASYQSHWDAIGKLQVIAGPAARLNWLQERLFAAAPEWTGMISRDAAAARRPADLDAAWQWRQLETWLRDIASLPDPAALQANLEELSADRRRTVTELVTERAWRRLADNLGRRERQALQSYVAAVTRYGKTGGKYAQRWIGEMREALDEAKTAVPVWIMPTARALSSFRPTADPPFDVLIIDEASQIGFEALPLLALSKSTIVVGDDKQTSPEHVGLDREHIFALMDDFLRGIPRYRTVFDPDRSLYDLATLRFSTPIMLTEHFRCLPEIISFSNHQAYGDQIIPLRDQPPHPGWIPLGLIRVLDGYRDGFVNRPEAQQVVALLSGFCNNPQYDGMTFGVISLLGTAQSKYIWELLYDQLGPDVVAERQIRCGEPANFQGDERDVMVLSTVIAGEAGATKTRFASMTGTPALRRINVAASRARNQMWVVTSVDPQSLPAGDLRAELIRHCAAPPAGEERQTDLLANCESEFERRVVRSLSARGYRAIEVQRKVGQYRLDIVVAGPNGRLAIECDGDRWHGEDVWHKDRARQEVLERAGWTFERIRGSSFFRDPDVAMEPVWRHLDVLGIPTGDEWIVNSPRGVTREVSGVLEQRPPEGTVFDPDDSRLESEQVSRTAVDHAPIIPDLRRHPSVGFAAAPESPVTETDWSPPAWYLASRGVGSAGLPARQPPDHSPPSVTSVPSRNGSMPPVSMSSARETITTGRDTVDKAPAAPPATRASKVVSSRLLQPFKSWPPRSLPAVDSASTALIMSGIAEIIAAEGPMHAVQAYQRYAKASGGQRVGRETHRIFDAINVRGVRTGQWLRIKDKVSNPSGATLYAPGSSAVVLRERGPRDLMDIPRSEIRTLMDALELEGVDPPELKRAVLNELGFVRMTGRTVDYLDECLRYKWAT